MSPRAPQGAAMNHPHVGQPVREEKDPFRVPLRFPDFACRNPSSSRRRESRPARIQPGDDPVERLPVPPHGTGRPGISTAGCTSRWREIVRPIISTRWWAAVLNEVELARLRPSNSLRSITSARFSLGRRCGSPGRRGRSPGSGSSVAGPGRALFVLDRTSSSRGVAWAHDAPRSRVARPHRHQDPPVSDPFRFHESPPFHAR